MKKTYYTYYSLLSILSAAAVFYTVFVGSLYVHNGLRYQKLSVEKVNLEKQKDSLQLRLAQEQNLDALKTYALGQGFSDISNITYINNPSALALR